MKKLVLMTMVLLVVAPVIAMGQAEAVHKAQNKLLAKRAAEADCYRKLAERIMGLRINAETLVRDFVTESDVIETEVNTFIKGIELGKPRYFDDGSCQVKGQVAYVKVIAELKKIYSAHYRDDRIKQSDFETMTTRKEKTMIEAVGNGAPRPDAPLEQMNGTVTQPADEISPSVPPLWAQIGPQGRLMAQRAATLDAYRKLGERLRGFRLDSHTLVRDFVTESDEIGTTLRTTLKGVKEVRTYFHDDEPICEVTVEIPWKTVLATIRKSYDSHIKDEKIRVVDFKEVTTRVEKKYYRATGMGIPPAKFLQKVEQTRAIKTPDWMSKPIAATGQAPIMTDKPAVQAKLMAARAAELDAKRKLAERINGFSIMSETSVKDFVTERDQIQTELNSVIAGAYVKRTDFGADSVQVTVEIPGMRVWQVIAEEMRVSAE